MSNNNGIDVEEPAFPTNCNYSHINENVVDTTNSNSNNGQTTTNFGGAWPVTSNEKIYYDKPESLFNRPLILVKQIKSPFDIRYKTDYFPRSGKNANVPQKPRYLHTVDNKQEIIIKLPDGYTVPSRPGDYLLEVALVTVPRSDQHHLHVNKFQVDHTDVNVPDQNPFFYQLTEENFTNGEIRVKLVIIKSRQDELQGKPSLQLFNEQTPSGWTAECESVENLKDTYELSSAKIAFSLGYIDIDTNVFVRFTNTTVYSNEIIEKEKSKPADNITCPKCSHCFSIQEQKKEGKKRSASSSNSTEKKHSS